MEAIKLEGNVMWIEFKHADLWHCFLFFKTYTGKDGERKIKEGRRE